MAWALHILLTGLAILVSAIVLNIAAVAAGIPTWYDFLAAVRERGLAEAARDAGLAGMAFLLVVYPFLLGLVAWIVGTGAARAP